MVVIVVVLVGVDVVLLDGVAVVLLAGEAVVLLAGEAVVLLVGDIVLKSYMYQSYNNILTLVWLVLYVYVEVVFDKNKY